MKIKSCKWFTKTWSCQAPDVMFTGTGHLRSPLLSMIHRFRRGFTADQPVLWEGQCWCGAPAKEWSPECSQHFLQTGSVIHETICYKYGLANQIRVSHFPSCQWQQFWPPRTPPRGRDLLLLRNCCLFFCLDLESNFLKRLFGSWHARSVSDHSLTQLTSMLGWCHIPVVWVHAPVSSSSPAGTSEVIVWTGGIGRGGLLSGSSSIPVRTDKADRLKRGSVTYWINSGTHLFFTFLWRHWKNLTQ